MVLAACGLLPSVTRASHAEEHSANDAPGEVVIDDAYADALDDLDGFERIWLLYWFDRAAPWKARVVPYLDDAERGLFATRAPSRPNGIGMTAVRLARRDGRVLHVTGIDVLDGTPLLDVKPYVPDFDAHPGSRAGWYDRRSGGTERDDARFLDRR